MEKTIQQKKLLKKALEQRVKENKFLKFGYKTLDYFEKGKSLPSRVYAPFNEIFLLLTYLAVSYELKFTPLQILIGLFAIFLMFVLFGMFTVKHGLQYLDSHTKAMHDPVQKKLLMAAEIIIEEKRKNEKYNTEKNRRS